MKEEKRKNTLMKRIITYFLIIIFCMALLNAYSSLRFKSFYSNVYTMLTRLGDIYSITVQIGTLHKDIDNYAHSGTKSYLESYDSGYEKVDKLVESLKNSAQGDEYYELIDIQNMITTFGEDSRNIIDSYDSKIQQVYIDESISELTRLEGYIEGDVKNVLIAQLGAIMTYYNKFLNNITDQENLTYLLTALITVICIVIAVRFSREISRPIHQLVQRLMKVAKGEFEAEKVTLKGNDEINVLFESYNFMSVKIKELIEEIRVKADIEKELTEQQIKNLEMSNLLNQSELKFLQSQINPHFLYNTLNSISALAVIESAEQTLKMIGCLSDILKYYLKKINENVTLKDEFKIVEDYLFIQKSRFGDRIEYILKYDEEVMGYIIPSMILQPFVENAIIHGLEPKEDRGRLEVGISDMGSDILIKVQDNGMGMNEETLMLFFQNGMAATNPGARGIGVSNVVRRLELKYGKNVVDIKSSQGKGTEVNILLPKVV